MAKVEVFPIVINLNYTVYENGIRDLEFPESVKEILALALTELDRESSNLGLPRDIREDAAFIYRNAAKNNLIRGRSIEGMVAASIYTACRRGNIPRTLDEIGEVSKVSKKQLGKNYRFLSRKLGIKLNQLLLQIMSLDLQPN